jgi:hypothetical protein
MATVCVYEKEVAVATFITAPDMLLYIINLKKKEKKKRNTVLLRCAKQHDGCSK